MLKFLKQYLASFGSSVEHDSRLQYTKLQHRITALESQVNNYERLVAVQKRMLDLNKNKITKLEQGNAIQREVITAYERFADTAKQRFTLTPSTTTPETTCTESP